MNGVPAVVVAGAPVMVKCVAGPGSTTCTSGAALLARKSKSPPYAAVIVWLPSASALDVKVATPFTRAGVPSTAAPSLKVTLPVGDAPAKAGVTVAVSVTLEFTIEGFCDEPSAVVVAAFPTIWLSGADALVRKLVVPR